MNRPIFITAVFVSLFPCAESNTVPLISSVSASVGAIGTFQRDDPAYSNSYAFYPEIQISGGFFRPSLSWIAFTGFWDDDIDTPAMSSGSPTYSFGGAIFGARVLFKPQKTSENWPLPVGVFAGFSRHAIRAEYVGGADPGIHPPADIRRNSNTFEFGFSAEKPLIAGFSLLGQVRQFVPFPDDSFRDVQKSRRAYTVGISSSF